MELALAELALAGLALAQAWLGNPNHHCTSWSSLYCTVHLSPQGSHRKCLKCQMHSSSTLGQQLQVSEPTSSQQSS